MQVSRRLAFGAVVLSLCGCTITQTARPVSIHEGESKAVCIIEDRSVNATFLPAYKAALERNGFAVTVLQPGSSVRSCPLTSTYTARWSWDIVTYMSLAKIVVYRDGTEVGDALYDAPKAGTALTFRIYESTSSKVDTMVDQLFPTPVSQ